MALKLQCQCGKEFTCSEYAHNVQGRKYCSNTCAKRFRVYTTKAETLSAKITVTLTEGQRKTLEHRAVIEGCLVTELGRRFIIEGLESA